jgi:hypothetical protein
VDHQTKNREHKVLVEAMETSLKRVVLLAGVPQRLLGKVAIVTGTPSLPETREESENDNAEAYR